MAKRTTYLDNHSWKPLWWLYSTPEKKHVHPSVIGQGNQRRAFPTFLAAVDLRGSFSLCLWPPAGLWGNLRHGDGTFHQRSQLYDKPLLLEINYKDINKMRHQLRSSQSKYPFLVILISNGSSVLGDKEQKNSPVHDQKKIERTQHELLFSAVSRCVMMNSSTGRLADKKLRPEQGDSAFPLADSSQS